MRLEVNGHTAAEEASPDTIRYAVGDLHPATETSILLHDADNVLLRADGVPKRGFSMSYINPNTGVELVSTNRRLKPRSVMRVMKHYLAGDELWRIDVAWQPLTEAAKAEQKQRAWQQSQPALTVTLFIVIACLPFLFFPLLALDPMVAVIFALIDALAAVGLVLWRRNAVRGIKKGGS